MKKQEPIIDFLSEKKIQPKKNEKETELLSLKIKLLDKKIELEKLKIQNQGTKPKMSEVCDSVETTEDSGKTPIYEDKTPDIHSQEKLLSRVELPLHDTNSFYPVSPDIPPKKKGFLWFKGKNKCPLCNSKLKIGKVIKGNNSMKQITKCKNPSCSYVKEYNF